MTVLQQLVTQLISFNDNGPADREEVVVMGQLYDPSPRAFYVGSQSLNAPVEMTYETEDGQTITKWAIQGLYHPVRVKRFLSANYPVNTNYLGPIQITGVW